jgi:hypothetical protein
MAADSPTHSNDLVIRRVERGTSTTVERLGEPRPGTYWRLLQAVTGQENDKQVQAPKLQAGTVLLLEDIEYADGEPHVYQFAAHPSVPERHAYKSKFHADCFFQYWTYCPEGAQVRESELLNVHQKMQESQALLMQPAPVAPPVGALGFDPSADAPAAVRTSALFKQEFIPGAFASKETYQYAHTWDYNRVYVAKDSRPVVACVRQDKRGIYIEVPLVHEYKERKINGRMYLEDRALNDVLVLDRLHAAELTYYLTSRSERRRYNHYVELFQVARAWVAERDAAEAPLRQRLRQAVAEGRIAHDPEGLEGAITDAMAIARAARRDRRAPDTNNSGFTAFLHNVLDTLHTLLSAQNSRVDAVQQWCTANGRRPLRLVSTGKGRFKVYLEPAIAEHDLLLGEPRHTTSATVQFDGSTGEAELSDWARELLRPSAGEHVVHDWQYLTTIPANPAGNYHERQDRTIDDGAAKWLENKSLLGTLRYEQAQALLQLPAVQSAQFQKGLDLEWLCKEALGSKGGYVVRNAYQFAVGIAHAGATPCLLIARHDMLAHVYATGSAADRAAALHRITSRYRSPETAVQELKSGRHGWQLRYVELEDAWRYRDEPHCMGLVSRGELHEKLVFDPALSVKENERRKVRCLALTEAGAALFPWLSQRTRSAL